MQYTYFALVLKNCVMVLFTVLPVFSGVSTCSSNTRVSMIGGSAMIVLAVDPGPKTNGVVVYDGKRVLYAAKADTIADVYALFEDNAHAADLAMGLTSTMKKVGCQ